MKLHPDHVETLRKALASFGAEKVSAHRQFIINEGKSKDADKRLRWDLTYYAGLSDWLCKAVYPYANDSHIDTALRHLMAELYPNI